MTLEEIRNRLVGFYHQSGRDEAAAFWLTEAESIVDEYETYDLDPDLLARLKAIGSSIRTEDFSDIDNSYSAAVLKIEEIIYDMRDRGIPAGGKDNTIG
jgi:hypothetical protein